jgi:hypothetical protein
LNQAAKEEYLSKKDNPSLYTIMRRHEKFEVKDIDMDIGMSNQVINKTE